MGVLLDQFDAERDTAKMCWDKHPVMTDTVRVEWRGYTATACLWQGKEWRMSVTHFSQDGHRRVTGAWAVVCKDQNQAESKAMDAIRADIVRREFIEEGPARLAALESEVAELKATVATLSAWLHRVAVFGGMF